MWPLAGAAMSADPPAPRRRANEWRRHPDSPPSPVVGAPLERQGHLLAVPRYDELWRRIAARPSDPPGLVEAARLCGVATIRFRREFFRDAGVTLSALLLEWRLVWGDQLLARGLRLKA